jgi:hypothetical protein
VHEVLGDQRLDRERGAARRRAVVGPLRGEHGLQLIVVGQAVEDVAGALGEGLLGRAREQALGELAAARGQQAREVVAAHRAGDLAHAVQVAVDRPLLGGEGLQEVLAEPLRGVGEVDVQAAGEVELVVDGAERGPLQAVIGEAAQQAAGEAALGDLADGVHADVPVVAAGALEAVGEAAGHVVLLEHEDALAELGEHARRRSCRPCRSR